jgi:hypothetical protein
MTRWPLIAVLLAGCPFYSRRPDPPKAPKTPTAIAGINSPFDDFNSADMSMYWRQQLVFSTNRGSKGAQFDLYQTNISFRTDTAQASEPTPFVPALMSEQDERGPIAIGRSEWTGQGDSAVWFALASNREGGAGGLDLYAAECRGFSPHREGPCADATELAPLAALNSPADDAYLSRPFAPRSVLFASNREGSRGMDIYTARWDEGKALADPPAQITLVEELSGEGDDTAPFVTRPTGATDDKDAELVFVSARPGGSGEHDIYCSRREQGRWTGPKNLGPKINSARDEYRPIIIEVNTTRFLIFSSTREGGRGGYDLYIVGYPGCR